MTFIFLWQLLVLFEHLNTPAGKSIEPAVVAFMRPADAVNASSFLAEKPLGYGAVGSEILDQALCADRISRLTENIDPSKKHANKSELAPLIYWQLHAEAMVHKVVHFVAWIR